MAATRIAGTTSTTSSAPPPSGVPTRADVMPKAQAENFTVASLLLSRPQRRALLGIYGFARLVDDIGDETAGDREAMLDWLEDDVGRMFSGRADPSAVAPARAVGARARLSEARVPAPDRREPAGSGGVPLRNLRRAGRLLRSLGQPGRRARALHVRRGHARARSRCPTRSAPGCSSRSTGRTWVRTTAAAAFTCRRKTWSGSASRRRSLPRSGLSERLQDAARFRGRARPAPARPRASASCARSSGRAKLAVAGYVGGGRAAFDAIASRRATTCSGARRRRRAARAAGRPVRCCREAR